MLAIAGGLKLNSKQPMETGRDPVFHSLDRACEMTRSRYFSFGNFAQELNKWRRYMPVTSEITNDGGTITIKVNGRFDFAVQNEFRDCYYNINDGKNAKFIIDMSGTNYMDSSALGMLLMMREYLGGNSADISIANTSADIKNILTVANFQSLFSMA